MSDTLLGHPVVVWKQGMLNFLFWELLKFTVYWKLSDYKDNKRNRVCLTIHAISRLWLAYATRTIESSFLYIGTFLFWYTHSVERLILNCCSMNSSSHVFCDEATRWLAFLLFFSDIQSNYVLFHVFRGLKMPNGQPYFTNYWDNYFNLYVLTTTANNPDIT